MTGFHRLLCAVGCGALMLLASACRTVGVDRPATYNPSDPVEHSIIFLIHGDADYLYHDADGTAHQADETALAKAVRVAERNSRAEVFIFHQRPKKRRLFLFPRDDGTFYYYRRGELIARETYRRETGGSRFEPEAKYVEQYRTGTPAPGTEILVYMGHEIPELGDVRYDASHGKSMLDVGRFARGVSGLTTGTGVFDLIVLSTCNGGTPHTIGALAPHARHIVASPDDLHLSHLDLGALERPGVSFGISSGASARSDGEADGESGILNIARDLARTSFERLSSELQTVVSIAVYDVKRATAYIDQVTPAYDSLLVSLQDAPPARLEYVDCAETPRFAQSDMSAGVEVLFRPPRFGRRADRTTHSGWQCLRRAESIP